jgi:hypothetical protein
MNVPAEHCPTHVYPAPFTLHLPFLQQIAAFLPDSATLHRTEVIQLF